MKRNPKVLIALMGFDQHEAGAIAVTKMLSNAGVEVVYGGRFNTPEGIAITAIDEDVDVVGLSCHSWEYIYFVDEIFKELHKHNKNIPVILGGSVITRQDEPMLKEKGVSGIFGASSRPADIISAVLKLAKADTKLN